MISRLVYHVELSNLTDLFTMRSHTHNNDRLRLSSFVDKDFESRIRLTGMNAGHSYQTSFEWTLYIFSNHFQLIRIRI